MSKSSRIVWWIIAILVIIGVIYYLSGVKEEAPVKAELDAPLTLGGIVPLTGDGAAYGLPIQRAAAMAISEINASGGIGGQPISITWEDGKCEGKEATLAAQKLVNVDRVKFIVGTVCSSEALAVVPISDPAKVIVISPSATSPDINKNTEEITFDYFFRLAPSDANAGRIAAEYAFNKLGLKKAAIISEQKDYAQGLHRVFKDVYTKLGGEVVVEESFQTGDTDFRTQILKVKLANPEVVYLLPQTPAPGVLLIKQLKENGVAAQLLTAEVLLGRDIIAEHKADMDGLVGIEQQFDAEADRAKAFLAKYKETYGEEAPFPAFMASMYAEPYLLKEAVEMHGLDTDKVRSWLLGLKNWPSAAGNITFTEVGEPVMPYAVRRVSNGELVQLDIVE